MTDLIEQALLKKCGPRVFQCMTFAVCGGEAKVSGQHGDEVHVVCQGCGEKRIFDKRVLLSDPKGEG